MERARLGLLPLVAVALAVAALMITVAGRDRPAAPEVVKADRIGSTYFSDVATFKARVLRALERHRGAHAAELVGVLDRQMKAKPTLPPPPEGAEKSETYQEAVKAQPTIFEPVDRLRRELEAAARAEQFVKAADDALERVANELRASGIVVSIDAVESTTLPAVRDARADFRRVPAPPEAHVAASAVDAVLSKAIRELEVLIEELEDGGSASFDLTADFELARQEVHNYAVVTDGNLREAVARLRDSA
jgi:hypothetical protein